MTIKIKYKEYNFFFSDILSSLNMVNKTNNDDSTIITRSFKRSISVRKKKASPIKSFLLIIIFIILARSFINQ